MKLQGIYLSIKALEEENHVPKLKMGSVNGIWLHLIGDALVKSEAEINPAIQQVVEEFGVVFAEPHGLPPPRSHDHKIQLQEGSKPKCVQPYIYP